MLCFSPLQQKMQRIAPVSLSIVWSRLREPLLPALFATATVLPLDSQDAEKKRKQLEESIDKMRQRPKQDEDRSVERVVPELGSETPYDISANIESTTLRSYPSLREVTQFNIESVRFGKRELTQIHTNSLWPKNVKKRGRLFDLFCIWYILIQYKVTTTPFSADHANIHTYNYIHIYIYIYISLHHVKWL